MLAAALAQVTWAPRFEVGGAFPNLVLYGVLGVTWTAGLRAGMVWACIGGCLLDLAAPGAIGPHALALLASAYVVGLWAVNFEHAPLIHVAVTAAVATVIYAAVLVLAAGLLGQPLLQAGAFVQLALAAALYNAVVMPFALELLRRLQGLTRSATESA
jgi:rod shape-determining protein MreD